MVGLEALLNVCASVEAKPPTCTQPVGKWKNRQKSVLEIKTYDAATGAISGEYTSHSGASASSVPYPVVGWTNSAPAESSAPGKAGKGHHAGVMAFEVSWGALGGISAWTGTCAVVTVLRARTDFCTLGTTRFRQRFEWDHTDRIGPLRSRGVTQTRFTPPGATKGCDEALMFNRSWINE